MKKLLLSFLALVVLGVGAYLWANWISFDEVDDLLTGEYALIDWRITSCSEVADSLIVSRTPVKGVKVQLELSDEHGFCIKSEDDAPVMLGVGNYSWKPLHTLRNSWFDTTHILQRCYASTALTETPGDALYGTRWESGLYSQATANFHLHRMWIGATYVSLTIDVIDPENKHLHWQLTFAKR